MKGVLVIIIFILFCSNTFSQTKFTIKIEPLGFFPDDNGLTSFRGFVNAQFSLKHHIEDIFLEGQAGVLIISTASPHVDAFFGVDVDCMIFKLGFTYIDNITTKSQMNIKSKRSYTIPGIGLGCKISEHFSTEGTLYFNGETGIMFVGVGYIF